MLLLLQMISAFVYRWYMYFSKMYPICTKTWHNTSSKKPLFYENRRSSARIFGKKIQGFSEFQKMQNPATVEITGFDGGESGIRTRGPVKGTAFRVPHDRPLWQLSKRHFYSIADFPAVRKPLPKKKSD